MFKNRVLAASILAGFTLASFSALALDAIQANSKISAAGYSNVHDVELKYGLWTAEAHDASGAKVDVILDPASDSIIAFDGRGTGAITEAQAREAATKAGYSDIKEIEFDDGFWDIEVRDELGREFDVVLHPKTGDILNQVAPKTSNTGASAKSADEIRNSLMQAGFTNVMELDYDNDGYWEADATNAQGQRVDVKVDQFTGAVISEHFDD